MSIQITSSTPRQTPAKKKPIIRGIPQSDSGVGIGGSVLEEFRVKMPDNQYMYWEFLVEGEVFKTHI